MKIQKCWKFERLILGVTCGFEKKDTVKSVEKKESSGDNLKNDDDQFSMDI